MPPTPCTSSGSWLFLVGLSACLLAPACRLQESGVGSVGTIAPQRADAGLPGGARDARPSERPADPKAAAPEAAVPTTVDAGADSSAGSPGAAVSDAAASDAAGGGGVPDAAAPADTAPPAVDPTNACPGDPDLVLCLRFEGSLRDDSPRRLPVRSDELDFARGVTGRAASLTPRSRVLVPEAPDLDAETVTLSVSVNPAELTTRMTVVENPGQYGLFILPSGSAMCSGAGGYALTGGVVAAGRWVHLLCTFDGANITLWVDGVQRARGPASPVPTDRRQGTRIGWDDDPPNQFVGLIDELRIWRVIRPPLPLSGAGAAGAALDVSH